MKLKKEWIILPVVVVVLVIYLLINMNKSGEVNYKMPELTKVESSRIDKIEFSTPTQDTITVVKDDTEDIWRLDPQGYPVNESTINKMVNLLVNLKIGELISDKQAYDKYELDPAHKITVKAYTEDKIVRSLDIGKNADVTNHSYIKLSEQPEVYSAGEDLRLPFDTDVSKMRDKIVLKANRDSITQIIIEYDGETVNLNKTVEPASDENDEGADTITWKIGDTGLVADTVKVNTIISTLANLSCDGFIAEGEEKDFSSPLVSVTLAGDKLYTLKALEAGEGENYPAISSGSDYQFELMSWKVDRLKKKVDDFLSEE